MKILHVAKLKGYAFAGVDVIVPQHLAAQSSYADIAFINVRNVQVAPKWQIDYNEDTWLNDAVARLDGLDLVVFHDVYALEYLKMSGLLRSKHIPYIIVPHGCLTMGAQRKKRFKKLVANILLFNRFIYGATALQCLSSSEQSQTKFNLKIFVGTNGISIPKICKSSFNVNSVSFVYVGRLDPFHKGIDFMLSAVRNQKDLLSANSCHFDLYGPNSVGGYEKVAALISEYELDDVVTLHHAVVGEEKEQILLKSDVFIQTSRFEGMPVGILEALSYGLPCLLTKGTTLGETIEEKDAGWCADTNSASIEQALQAAISQKSSFAKKGLNGRNLVTEEFEWSKIAQSTIATYKSILDDYNVNRKRK